MTVRRSMPVHRWALTLVVLFVAACSSGPVAPDPVPAASSSVAPAPTPTPTPEPVTHEFTGTLTVRENTYVDGDPASPCVPALSTTSAVKSGVTGFEDIDAGAQVTLYDAAGAIIATTTLGDGVLVDVTETRQIPDRTGAGPGPDLAAFMDDLSVDFDTAYARYEAAVAEWEASLPQFTRTYGQGCRFPFTAVIGDAGDFFSVEVAHRGKVNFSRADLEATGWRVELSL